MQCYHYLASTLSVANLLETVPGAPKKLPPSVVADWMEANRLDAEDLLLASDDEIRAAVERLAHQTQPEIPHAA